MSLGLNDLKKRSTKTSIEKKTAKPTLTQETVSMADQPVAKTKEASDTWARGNRTARPWTANGLTKGPKGRKANTQNPEAFMSSEWANEHTSSIRAFDMEVQTALTQLRDLQLSVKEHAIEIERKIEQKIKRAAMSPFHIMRAVLTMVQK